MKRCMPASRILAVLLSLSAATATAIDRRQNDRNIPDGDVILEGDECCDPSTYLNACSLESSLATYSLDRCIESDCSNDLSGKKDKRTGLSLEECEKLLDEV